MSRVLRVGALLLCLSMLAGCGSTHYTNDIKKEYEDNAFLLAQERLEAIADDTEHITYELYAPDGVTNIVTGRFLYDGHLVQYVYDAEGNSLYAGRTRAGYTHTCAKEYIQSEIAAALEGTNLMCSEVRTLSWQLPFVEYRYRITKTDGETRVMNPNAPTQIGGWLNRPYFLWDDRDDDVEAFLTSILYGSPDQVSNLTVVLLCDSFADGDVWSELDQHGLMTAMPGIRTVLLYEESNDDAYYEQTWTASGIRTSWHERKPSRDGSGYWSSSELSLAIRDDSDTK